MRQDKKGEVKLCGFRLWIAAALTAVFTVPVRAETPDTYLPWEGGAAYYAQWSLGPPSNQDYFSRGVWLQIPFNAPLYEGVGVNQYVGLNDGTFEVDPSGSDGPLLPLLRDYKMPVFGDQASGLLPPNGAEHLLDPIINGWTQEDEPDNAQSLPAGGYGDCILPSQIVNLYTGYKAADPNRPVFLGLGQGTGYPTTSCYNGRGSTCCTGTGRGFADYPTYIQGADIVSSDVYPQNDAHPLFWMSRTTDRLRYWSNYAKPVWQWIEMVNINADSSVTLSPAEVQAEIWMTIIHGGMGYGLFAHQFAPNFEEDSIFWPEHASVEAAVAATDIQVAALARVLNKPPVANGVTVTSSNANAAISTLLKRYGGSTFLLAVNDGLPTGGNPLSELSLFCRGDATCTNSTAQNAGSQHMLAAGGTTATFTLRDFPANATAIVLGENIQLSNLPVQCPAGGYNACKGYFAPDGPNPITYTQAATVGQNRTIPIVSGVFSDAFATSYAYHLYQIQFDPNSGAPLVGDVNGDGKVDYHDFLIVKAALGTTGGMPGYDPRADVIRDGVVDNQDLALVGGKTRHHRLLRPRSPARWATTAGTWARSP